MYISFSCLYQLVYLKRLVKINVIVIRKIESLINIEIFWYNLLGCKQTVKNRTFLWIIFAIKIVNWFKRLVAWNMIFFFFCCISNNSCLDPVCTLCAHLNYIWHVFYSSPRASSNASSCGRLSPIPAIPGKPEWTPTYTPSYSPEQLGMH